MQRITTFPAQSVLRPKVCLRWQPTKGALKPTLAHLRDAVLRIGLKFPAKNPDSVYRAAHNESLSLSPSVVWTKPSHILPVRAFLLPHVGAFTSTWKYRQRQPERKASLNTLSAHASAGTQSEQDCEHRALGCGGKPSKKVICACPAAAPRAHARQQSWHAWPAG